MTGLMRNEVSYEQTQDPLHPTNTRVEHDRCTRQDMINNSRTSGADTIDSTLGNPGCPVGTLTGVHDTAEWSIGVVQGKSLLQIPWQSTLRF